MLEGTPEDVARQLGERGLCRKLLAERHLNSVERKILPEGRARFSVLVEVVREALDKSPWFPHPIPTDGIIGVGGLLESRNGELWIHTQAEVGVSRFGPMWSSRLSDIHEAVRRYVRANGDGLGPGQSQIDGVPIDWDN